MLWIKEVEVAKSVDDLMRSQSNEGHVFPDFEMLDAKIASALKRIITNQYFRRRINVEKQHAPKYDRFLRGRQIAYMIYEHYRATGAHEAGNNLYFLQVKYPKKMSWRVVYKMKARETAQLQTVLAVYDQEIDRDRAVPSYQRLKTMARGH